MNHITIKNNVNENNLKELNMSTYKEVKSISDITSHVIVKIEYSSDGKYIGIKTQNSVLFIEATSSPTSGAYMKVVTAVTVPKDLLEKLDFEFGLVSKVQIKNPPRDNYERN
jgi:hypothetical protein